MHKVSLTDDAKADFGRGYTWYFNQDPKGDQMTSVVLMCLLVSAPDLTDTPPDQLRALALKQLRTGFEIRYGIIAKKVDSIAFNNKKAKFDARLLSWVVHVRDCESLSLHGSPLKDGDIKHLRNASQLKELSISQTDLTNKGIADIAKLRHLQSLSLGGNQVTAESLTFLTKCEELERLYVDFAIADDDVFTLVRIPNLKTLALGNGALTSEGVARLGGIATLEELRLDRKTLVDDAGIAWIAELPKLRSLELADTSVTDAGMAHFARLTKLQRLVLSKSRISARGCGALQHLVELEVLKIRGELDDSILGHIERLPKLKEVTLTDDVSTEGVLNFMMKRPDVVFNHPAYWDAKANQKSK